MSLLPALQTLASPDASPRQRNEAVRQLQAELRQRGSRLAGRDAGASLSEDDLEDVLQHVLEQASVGQARCRAQTEGEAWTWCKSVAYHKALDLIGQRRRERPTDDPYAGVEPEATPPEEEQRVWRETDQVLQNALDASKTSARGDDKAVSVGCAIEYIFHGASTEQQIDRWGFPGGRPATLGAPDLKRARDRVYAYRSRGVAYLEEALDRLEAQGDLSATDTALVRRLISQHSRKKKSPVR